MTAALSLRGAWDLDGRGLGGGSLASLEDTRGGPFDLRLDRAWVAFHLPDDGAELRLGRQTLFDTPVLLHLDGLSLRAPLALTPGGAALRLYGGVPEHRWETSRSGDAVAGAVLETWPWPGTSARLDLLHVRDRSLAGRSRDSLLALRLARTSPDGRAFASLAASWRDGRTRDLKSQFSWSSEDGKLQVLGDTRFLMARENTTTPEFDAFQEILTLEQPYREGSLQLSAELPGALGASATRIELGALGRRLEDSARASEFNREFEREWLTTTFESLPWTWSSLALTGEFWSSGQDAIGTGGAEFRGQLAENWELVLGSAYSLYRFDFFTGRERTRVRDHHLRLRLRLPSGIRFTLDLELQRDESERFVVAALQTEIPW